jgi:hypothetical protein
MRPFRQHSPPTGKIQNSIRGPPCPAGALGRRKPFVGGELLATPATRSEQLRRLREQVECGKAKWTTQ